MKLGLMGRCSHPPGTHDPLIGKQNNGEYNTAKAKIYPPGLNAVLGEELCHFAASLGTEGRDTTLPSVFAPLLSQQQFDNLTVQPDFHR